ncbi:hypothetical protein LOTGIDRAFT_114147 [Lottia gigantea]|uniref:Uncharacterized protein n=1 Tax=Lottia gigantea TaxID=225164 RepID=V4A502_LOTGI|nr:hypothetical protein LOTGIDRAFT_114147 [Lottia gigantea]ESO98973.1 hypothetical protein LOTGIDRAFT_114147 [Lottia gigantea]
MLETYLNKIPVSTTTQALLLGVTIGAITYTLFKKKTKIPPGPRPLPLIGNLLLLNSSEPLFKLLFKWRKEYGSIITLYMGNFFKMITLNNADVVNDALVKKGGDFAGRMHLHSLEVISEGYKSIAMADTTYAWKLQRKLSLQGLRQYLSGNKLEEKLHESVSRTIRLLKEKENEPVSILSYISLTVFNLLTGVCFSKSYEMGDKEFIELVSDFDTFSTEFGNGLWEDIVPLLKYWPTKKYNRLMKMFNSFLDVMYKNYHEHVQSFSEDNLKDFTDFMIYAKKQAAVDDPNIENIITDTHIVQTIADIFGAGVDTSRQTIVWTLYLLAENPEIQKKVQSEIDEILDLNQAPSVKDRSSLPYTEAVLHESMRICPVAPLSVPHTSQCDTTLGEYEIQKGTTILINTWALHMDPETWGDPEVFRPERFLDEDGSLAPKTMSWLPFSAGRRNCLGETIARPELHLILAVLLRNFTFDKAVGPSGETWTMEPASGGFTFLPPDNYMKIQSRK